LVPPDVLQADQRGCLFLPGFHISAREQLHR
jgi:hypothetical protein